MLHCLKESTSVGRRGFSFLFCSEFGDRPLLDLKSGVWDIRHEGGRLEHAWKSQLATLCFCMRQHFKGEVTIACASSVSQELVRGKGLYSSILRLSAFLCFAGRILASHPEMSLSPNLVLIVPPCLIVKHILLYDITIWLNVKRHCVI